MTLIHEGSDHRALHVLRSLSEDTIPENDACPLEDGEVGCLMVNDIGLDLGKVAELIEPILFEFVDPVDQDGQLDKIFLPLEELRKPLPGISDITGQEWTVLTVAKTFIGAAKSGAGRMARPQNAAQDRAGAGCC